MRVGDDVKENIQECILKCLAYFISAIEHHKSIRSVMKLFKTFKTPKTEAYENIIYKIIHF